MISFSDTFSVIFVIKVFALICLISNCIIELCIRIKEANNEEESLHGSDVFGPICLLISFLLAFTMILYDKVIYAISN